MTRTLPTARMPARPPLAALLAALAFAATPTAAVADVQIPLDPAVSPQYQAAEAVVDAVAQAPAAPVAAPIPDVPAVAPAAPAAPAPEPPRYQPDPAPQYHEKAAPSNSDFVSQPSEPVAAEAAAPAREAPADEPAPKQPADDPPAPEPDRQLDPEPARGLAPAPAVEDVAGVEGLAAIVGSITDVTDPTDSLTPIPQVGTGVLEAPGDAPPAPPTPVATGGGNLNVSIRIFSPGDDGPVTQVVNGGAGQAAPAANAPTTWIWNWHWSGAAGCDPGPTGNRAPPLGVAGWIWTWTCGPAGSTGALSDVLAGTLPELGYGRGILRGLDLDSLTGVDLPLPAGIDLPDLDMPADLSAKAESAADAPESRAGRERPGSVDRLVTTSAPLARVQASLPLVAASALIAATPPRKRLAARSGARDTKRRGGLIPAGHGSAGPPATASAGAAAAAASGSGPGLLTTLVLASLSIVAGWLLAGVGLPRLKLRSSRLERPG
jgi:hypothetical protein